MTSSAKSTPENRGGSYLLDIKGAAEVLHVQPRWVDERVRSGELRYVQLGKFRRFRLRDLDEFVAERVTRRTP